VTLKPAKKASQRAVLEPGFSPLDWAALTSNPNHKLRGANLPGTLIKVTPSMLKAQNGRKGTDAWTSYQGKVYNISPYLPFHPGGKGELLRGAGKDSGKLFLEIHPWVNWDAILGECLVGILVSENEAVEENRLDAMD
jgi:cytochrome b involved in lipid metabolism